MSTNKTTIRKLDAFSPLLRMRNPKNVDQMFDLVCAANYFAGQFDSNIPVDRSREVFEHIKKLLSLPKKGSKKKI